MKSILSIRLTLKMAIGYIISVLTSSARHGNLQKRLEELEHEQRLRERDMLEIHLAGSVINMNRETDYER